MLVQYNQEPITQTDLENIFESVKFIDDIKKNMTNTKELREQWKKVADQFVKHKWIYRYINDKQKEQLEKHYEKLTNEKTPYSIYKRSFNAICKFMGIPNDKVIIENMVFTMDKKDKDQWELALKYSKGLVKVSIPKGIRLIHISPVEGIKELIPSFRSKVKGKYMYPSKRIFFTIAKDINSNKAGLEGQKTYRYTPKKDIDTAYIDPTYADFSSGAVYIEVDSPVPVETLENRLFRLFGIGKKSNNKEEATNDL